MPTYLLTIAYHGSTFHGWQQQQGQRTVQGELKRAFAAIDRPGVHVEGAGRTDAGVHAFGQAAHVVLDKPFPLPQLVMALNTHLPDDVAVQSARLAPEGFHARFHAAGKRYLYRCVCSSVRPAVGRDLFHWVRRPIDLAAMRAAAQCLRGRHDFATFATNPGYPRKRGTVRTLSRVHLVRRPFGFDFVVEGSGFLHNMVRNLIGSLLEVGNGNRPPGWIAEVLAACDRRRGGPAAPPEGLYLLRVLYAKDLSPAGIEPGRALASVDGELEDEDAG
jgi:tRNA pseudouridine38-40 synthase